jgi:hypothetical protein
MAFGLQGEQNFFYTKINLKYIADIVVETYFMQIGCNLEFLEKKSFLEMSTLFLHIFTPLGQYQKI